MNACLPAAQGGGNGTIMDQGPIADPEALANSFWVPGRTDLWGGYSGGNWFIAPVWRSSEAIWRSGNTFIIRWGLLGDHGGGWTAGKGYDSYDTYAEARLSADLYFSRFPDGQQYTLPYKRARFQKSMQALQASFNRLFNTYFNNLLSAPANYPGKERNVTIKVDNLLAYTNDLALNAPWLKEAFKYYRLKGNPDPYVSNGTIIDFFSNTTYRTLVDKNWCAAFLNTCFENVGIKGTNSASALSFKDWGYEVEEPMIGAVVVFDWKNSGKGHVGIIVGIDKKGNLLVYGGNQSNSVRITSFPSTMVDSYRFPLNY